MSTSPKARLVNLTPKKPKRKAPKLMGRPNTLDTCDPTDRQYHLLLILDRYGWCTAEMVQEIASHYGLKVTVRRVRKLLWQLEKMGYAITKKLKNGTKAIAYAASEAGIQDIEVEGDNLRCDTNVLTDPAGMFHFLSMNQIMLQFRRAFPASYWLTDFEVRSERMGRDGLAKDYDAVAELQLLNGPIRIGIEYETKQQEKARYKELFGAFSAENFLHLILYFVKTKAMLSSVSVSFEPCRVPVGFVHAEEFRNLGMQSYVQYWVKGEAEHAQLSQFLPILARYSRPAYEPIHPFVLGTRV